MGVQTAQLSGIIRYELLMHWRRRSLPILIGFVIVALIGFTLLAGSSNFGADQQIIRIERDPADPSALVATQRTADGSFTTMTLTGQDASTVPEWLIGVDLAALGASLQIVFMIGFATQALLVALLPLLGEVIPLDQQYKVRQVLDALPLGRAVYLGGKLLGTWIGIIGGLIFAAVVFGIYSYVRYGAFQLDIYVQVWVIVVIPAALIVSGWTILTNAFTTSRRGAVLISLALIPFVIAIYMQLILSIYQAIIRTPEQATNGYINYQALLSDLFREMGSTLAIHGVIVGGLAFVIWMIARWREGR